jgi:hypothetical protein
MFDGEEDYIQFLSCLQGLSATLVLNIDRFLFANSKRKRALFLF